MVEREGREEEEEEEEGEDENSKEMKKRSNYNNGKVIEGSGKKGKGG